MMNRIELEHKKLHIAIIALNGRLSTQQLKLNIKRYFSDYISKIETKMLYELEIMPEKSFDYYLCSDYGKNMAIPYSPIYFADSNMNENEYVSSLNDVFYHAYQYDETLPKIESEIIKPTYRFNQFNPNINKDKFETLIIENKTDKIHLAYCLNAENESFKIYFFPQKEDFTLHGYTKFILINININNNPQKLKMLMNIVNKIANSHKNLTPLCLSKQKSYKYFFTDPSEP